MSGEINHYNSHKKFTLNKHRNFAKKRAIPLIKND